MKYLIDRQAGSPAYMQLYRQLREDIVSGVLPTGTKLPSGRVMASELGISLITVRHAYDLLADDGYIVSRERSGQFVSFGGLAVPQRAASYTASVSAPDDGFPFSVFAKTIRRVLSQRAEQILLPSPSCGISELREAISAYLARSRGISAPPERIIIGSGAEYLYGIAVQLLGRDTLFAIEDPCYPKIRQVYEANGAKCQALEMGADGIVSGRLAGCSAGVLHVTPYHSFPSGVTAPAPKRREYAMWARERDSYIIEDDYDSEFAVATKQIETVYSLAPDRVIYMNTFSRTMAPALRMGYMLLPEVLFEKYRQKLDFYSCTVPTLDQYVLAEFINNGDLERCITRRRRRQRQG